MVSNDPAYPDMKTVDGNGNTVENSSAISWLDSLTLSDGREDSESRDTESFGAKIKFFFGESIKIFFKARLMKLMLNTFVIFGWI